MFRNKILTLNTVHVIQTVNRTDDTGFYIKFKGEYIFFQDNKIESES